MKTSITISLLPSSPKMPFVFGPDLSASIAESANIGFDAVELFPPSIEAIDQTRLKSELQRHSMKLSTIGTGGGAVSQGLTLTDADSGIRVRAIGYIKQIMNIAAEFGASAIIGSMQGKAGARERHEVIKLLRESIYLLDQHAANIGQSIFYEPLNRYESDLTCTIQDAVELIESSGGKNIMVLADLFHMNIEEQSINESIKKYSYYVGHVHFVDSNRLVAGCGHTQFEPIVAALRHSDYEGYLAVEAYPLPDQLAAATKAKQSFDELLGQ